MTHIVITGVAQGLGRALTDQFIRLGHTVYGCDVQGAAIAQLTAEYPAPHHFACVDVTQATQVQQWATTVLEIAPAPDLLINNAGTMPPLAPFWEVPAADFDRTLDINVKGVANVIRAFAPAMVAQQRGAIVTVSAKWGRQGAAKASPFCTSKWAIEGLTQSLAQELPPGMAAVTFAPGAVHTHALEVVHGVEKAATYLAPAEWAAHAAPFLLTIGAGHNGQALTLPSAA